MRTGMLGFVVKRREGKRGRRKAPHSFRGGRALPSPLSWQPLVSTPLLRRKDFLGCVMPNCATDSSLFWIMVQVLSGPILQIHYRENCLDNGSACVLVQFLKDKTAEPWSWPHAVYYNTYSSTLTSYRVYVLCLDPETAAERAHGPLQRITVTFLAHSHILSYSADRYKERGQRFCMIKTSAHTYFAHFAHDFWPARRDVIDLQVLRNFTQPCLTLSNPL